MTNPDGQMRSVLATLEQCRVILARSANPEAAQLLSVAILQIRMQAHHIADSELKALCDAMVDAEPAEKSDDRAPSQDLRPVRRGSALLRLVK